MVKSLGFWVSVTQAFCCDWSRSVDLREGHLKKQVRPEDCLQRSLWVTGDLQSVCLQAHSCASLRRAPLWCDCWLPQSQSTSRVIERVFKKKAIVCCNWRATEASSLFHLSDVSGKSRRRSNGKLPNMRVTAVAGRHDDWSRVSGCYNFCTKYIS